MGYPSAFALGNLQPEVSWGEYAPFFCNVTLFSPFSASQGSFPVSNVFLRVLKEQPCAVFPKHVQYFPNVSKHQSDLPSGLVNSQIITGPHPQISASAGLRCGLRVYISNKSPWDAEVAGWALL